MRVLRILPNFFLGKINIIITLKILLWLAQCSLHVFLLYTYLALTGTNPWSI